ncbi:MAG: transposase, partial [Thermomicrobiales bacterium]
IKMQRNPEYRNGRNHRLRSYDYRSGAGYFITICTNQREPLLGEIDDGIVYLSYPGDVVLTAWENLEERFPTAMTDMFVIMPNHIHGILFLGTVVDEERAVAENGRASPTATHKEGPIHVAAGLALPSSQYEQIPRRNEPPKLGDVIGAFKSISARNANKILGRTGQPFWQRNYYEHIIRDDASLERIRKYIANNPVNWAQDEENTERR